MKSDIVVKDDLYQAAAATLEANGMTRKFAEMFGTKAEIVQGERRFEIRRLAGTNYLMDRRMYDRRRH